MHSLQQQQNAGRVKILEDRSLRIDNITMEDVGEYTCEADNDVGVVVASAMLFVHCKSDLPIFSLFPVIIIGCY